VILQALRDLAVRERLMDDPDFEPVAVRWVVHLTMDGHFIGVDCTDQADNKGKSRPLQMSVPRRIVRTSGSAANFLVDKAEYVLGYDPDENPKKVERAAHNRQLFIDFVKDGLGQANEDAGLLAIARFLENESTRGECVSAVRDRVNSNDLFCFSIDDPADRSAGRAHERPAVRRAWQHLRARPSVGDQAKSTCVVCGEKCVPLSAHPQIKRVPGGSTSGIALVSFNSPAFLSLGFEGSHNAPICAPCADAYTTALNRLFHPAYPKPGGMVGEVLPRRSFPLSADTSVIYWAAGDSKVIDEFGDLAYADESKADALFNSVYEGAESVLDDPTAFHALIVTGGQGRATLRGYHQTTVGDAARALQLYFQDVDIVPRFPRAPKRLALRALIRCLAPRGKDDNIDPSLAGQLFLAIMKGSPFPVAVLRAAVQRVRHEPESPERGEHKHTRERLALIRAYLNRRFRANDPTVRSLLTEEVKFMLDPSCRDNAYCLGRLFAVLEKLQAEAIGNINATIADRYYGAASATPVAVFGTLMRKAQHHLPKMEGHFYQTTIQGIVGLLEPANAFPKTLSLEKQGLFALGYYHQRAKLWPSKTGEKTNAAPTSAEISN